VDVLVTFQLGVDSFKWGVKVYICIQYVYVCVYADWLKPKLN